MNRKYPSQSTGPTLVRPWLKAALVAAIVFFIVMNIPLTPEGTVPSGFALFVAIISLAGLALAEMTYRPRA